MKPGSMDVCKNRDQQEKYGNQFPRAHRKTEAMLKPHDNWLILKLQVLHTCGSQDLFHWSKNSSSFKGQL